MERLDKSKLKKLKEAARKAIIHDYKHESTNVAPRPPRGSTVYEPPKKKK